MSDRYAPLHGARVLKATWLSGMLSGQGEVMQYLRLDHFASHVNETFKVEIEHVNAHLVLVEARPLPYRPVAGIVREPFSLLFRHESAVLFPQRTYNMKHEVMGEFGIFLVPVARDRDGFIYQALFN